MHTLKTIVAAAVVTLAATTVAYAGMNGVGGQSPSAPAPAKAVAAHAKQSRTAAAAVVAKAQRRHTKHAASSAQKTVRVQTHEASHVMVHGAATVQSRERDQTRDPDRARDRDQTRDGTCDVDQEQTRDQTRVQICAQSGDPAGAHAGYGSHGGGGCGD
jgi:hypothetical protein